MVQSVEESPAGCLSRLFGPGCGQSGAIRLGQSINSDNLFSVDMGGTSYDVCLIRNG
jgi:N-methylhydantoinase A/oxoprolinase/acetone carboxylase beta subunit